MWYWCWFQIGRAATQWSRESPKTLSPRVCRGTLMPLAMSVVATISALPSRSTSATTTSSFRVTEDMGSEKSTVPSSPR